MFFKFESIWLTFTIFYEFISYTHGFFSKFVYIIIYLKNILEEEKTKVQAAFSSHTNRYCKFF
jgi:CRISPR/Cas system-associated endonuclease Cas3-HD